jgi:hypothetical protein
MIRRLVTLIVATLGLSWGPPYAPGPESPARPRRDATPEELVQERFVRLLAAEYSARPRFTRARLPPQAMRVRMLDSAARSDAEGGAYIRFAIDECHGANAIGKGHGDECDWHRDRLTGCVYMKSGDVFVRRGDEMLPAALVLGVQVSAAPVHVCRG